MKFQGFNIRWIKINYKTKLKLIINLIKLEKKTMCIAGRKLKKSIKFGVII